MKTRVAVSNFSLDLSHFKSFDDLNDSLSKLLDVKTLLPQKKVEFYAGYDITEHCGFGLSLTQQLDNFQFMGDLGLQGLLLNTLYQSHLLGFNLSFSTDELMAKSAVMPKAGDEAGYVMYIPHLNIMRHHKFKNKGEFDTYYEELLSTHPVNSESYYERASSHFTNVTYQADCRKTLDNMGDGGINSFSKAITKCLKALNDHKSEMKIPQDLDILGHMADCDCSPQGSNGKGDMKFSFPEISENDVNCEYHLKPHSSNDSKDSNYYHKRIYFTFANIQGDIRTFVASIGPHL
ncbi:hypothetical protein [Vibrio cyclitrophicus]|uniref:hypothetical protein n=1 Tax=Vibrio cyclitrophicus TaxID=47951 RepID=UPI000C822691|nr:hypothetical protein [Vibrio cyclitrophicus]PME18649.1 hypothetical protein BCV41_09370 [Vibrio cyclitrophicus]